MSARQRVALVTGAASGIGSAIAQRLARDGFAVAAVDLNLTGAQSVADVIVSDGGCAIAVEADVCRRSAIESAVERATLDLGGFDVIVNNAGIGPVQSLLDVTEEDFDRIMKVNVLSVVWGMQIAAKKFMDLGHGGKIINAASQAGHRGDPFVPVYAASKFAVRGLTQSAAMELAPHGITVNAYCPGLVDTPMWRHISSTMAADQGRTAEEVREESARKIALGRFQTPDDVAAFVSFLAGPDSDYMTGQSPLIDGGMVFS